MKRRQQPCGLFQVLLITVNVVIICGIQKTIEFESEVKLPAAGKEPIGALEMPNAHIMTILEDSRLILLKGDLIIR